MQTTLNLGEMPLLSKDASKPVDWFNLDTTSLERHPTSKQVLEELIGQKKLTESLRFLAAALPKREAVWWGSVALRMHSEELPEAEETALRAATHWVLNPVEANRRHAGRCGEHAGADTIAGCLAMGAFWSSGSMSGDGLPAVQAPEHLTARAISGALLMIAAEAEDVVIRQAELLTLGIEMARNNHRWEIKQ